MTKNEMSQPLPWTVRVDDADRQELVGRLTATPEQRAEIARLAELQSLNRLAFEFEIDAIGKHRFRLIGMVHAEAVQTCVITLAPVPAKMAEPVRVEFWPGERLAGGEPPHLHGADEADEPEQVVAGRLDIGRIAYETFVAALDPYPRAPGAEFSWTEGGEERGGPFAALQKLKSG